jgi:peptide/nickel transport system permease protein
MDIKEYIARRILYALFVVYFVATTVFFSVRAIPGDPVSLMLGSSAGPTARQALREELGLNQPIYVQYVEWLVSILRGDLGQSIFSRQPVLDQLIGVAEPTLSIGLVGIVIATTIAIPTGIISAVRQYHFEDHVATFIAFLGISMPSFWMGIVLILVFSATLNVLPAFSYVSFTEGIVPWFRHVLLPAIAVGVPYGGILMRMTRSSMQEVLNEDYMRTARAKGLDERLVLLKHGLQNALIPVVTIAGILFGLLLGGVVAVEIVFGYQGLGRLLINSIQRRDFPIVQGSVIVISFLFVFMNLLIDLVYPVLDPRIRYGGN